MERVLDEVKGALGTDIGPKLKGLRYLYKDPSGKTLGGIVVSDKLGKRPSSLLFP